MVLAQTIPLKATTQAVAAIGALGRQETGQGRQRAASVPLTLHGLPILPLYLFIYLSLIFFNVYLFLRERERGREREGEREAGAEREGDTESEAGSRL